MRKLVLLCITLIAISCADKSNKKIAEKAPINVGVLTVEPMNSHYYKIYVGEVGAAGIGISYGFSTFASSNHNAIGLATISIPISNRGKGSMKLKRLDNEIQKAVNEKEHLTSQLLLQARQLWLNLNVTWEQMKVAEENLELAEKNVYDQMSRFNAGLIPISDVMMNQTSLFEATENLINKQIEYSKALRAYNGRKSK